MEHMQVLAQPLILSMLHFLPTAPHSEQDQELNASSPAQFRAGPEGGLDPREAGSLQVPEGPGEASCSHTKGLPTLLLAGHGRLHFPCREVMGNSEHSSCHINPRKGLC